MASKGKKARRSPARKPASKSAAPKRPSQIPAAQWKTLGATSRKRYAGYFKRHPTGTLQQARGHRPGEHAVRRSREDQRIEDFAERQAYRGEKYGSRSAEEIAEDIRENVKRLGFREGFVVVEQAIDALNERYREIGQPSGRDKSWTRLADLSELAAKYSLPESELFYH